LIVVVAPEITTLPLKNEVPFTLSLCVGDELPIPTLPDSSANLTVPVSSTSILGIPEISLTAKIMPVILSEILKSCPVFPEKERTSLVSILAIIILLEFESTKFTF
jgi:hypothetical protein